MLFLQPYNISCGTVYYILIAIDLYIDVSLLNWSSEERSFDHDNAAGCRFSAFPATL